MGQAREPPPRRAGLAAYPSPLNATAPNPEQPKQELWVETMDAPQDDGPADRGARTALHLKRPSA